MSDSLPDGWGNDPLSKFMAGAYHNCVASFVNYSTLPIMTAIKEVDACFRDALRISFKPISEIFLPSFMGRCHAAYLSAVQLSMGGQVPEAYPLVRLCLENALYALFVQDDPTIGGDDIPQRWKIWLDRDVDDAAERKCRNTFAYGKVRDHLVSRDAALGNCAHMLYQRTIKYGAHPNFYGQAQAGVLSEEGGNVQYLLPNTIPCVVCIQTAVHAGICVLGAFGLNLQGRYEETGIPARIKRLNWPMQKAEVKGEL